MNSGASPRRNPLAAEEDWSWTNESRDWVPPAVDTSRVSAARIYDYLLDGKDNFAVDREAAQALERVAPDIRETARANRRFLVRAVEAMVTEHGIRQFLDLGTGIPTSPSVHEVALRLTPDVRVAYIDNDPVVLAHTRAILSEGTRTLSLQHDLRDPTSVLADPALREHLDLSRPVGVLMVAVMHFVAPDVAPSIVKQYRRVMAPGSCLALSTACREGSDTEALRVAEGMYAHSDADLYVRTTAQAEELFEGFALPEPLDDITRWRCPGGSPFRIRALAGLGIKALT